MLYYGLEQHSLDSYFQFKELGSAPSTPTTNEIRLYAKDDGSGVSTLCYKNDAGTEICFPSSGTIVTGTGVSGRLAFWNGTSTLTSDADLTFSVDTLTATKIIAPTSITISTLTSGSLVFAGASGLLSQDNSNLFWDDTNNRLGIGTTTPERTLHAVLSGSATQPIGAHNYSGGATTPINGVLFRSARGTVGSPTAVQADDTAVVLAFQGYGATGFSASKRASVEMLPGENWTDAAQGTYLRFLTTALTGTTTAERFRVGPSGQWGIGGATFGTAGQYFRSGGASAAPTWATIDHNTELANVASGDVHTQYALLAGRSGGQILIGGTASGDDLTLKSTSNATKGSVQVTDSEFLVGNGASPTAGLNVSSIASTGTFPGGDWIAWVRRESSASPSESLIRHQHFSGGAHTPQPIYAGIGARGTLASPVTLSANDYLLILDGRGYDGSVVDHGEYAVGWSDTAAQIAMRSGATWSGTDHTSYMTFSTTPSGSITPVERLRIGSTGFIGHLGYASNPFASWVAASDADYSVVWDSFNAVSAATSAALVARRARGSQASPSAVNSGDTLFTFQARGYQTDLTHVGGAINFLANENFDSTHGGTVIQFLATANGSIDASTKMSLQDGLQVGSPTGGDKGAGTINAAGAYYANGTAGVASFGPSAVTSITVKNGIITAIS